MSWEYSNRTRIYVKRWPKIYYGHCFDTVMQRSRPVRWALSNVNTNDPHHIIETWTWTYIDNINYMLPPASSQPINQPPTDPPSSSAD